MFLAAVMSFSACGSSSSPTPSGSSSSPIDPGPQPEPEPGPQPEEPEAQPECDESFESTFDAVQTVVFEREGCTGCHNEEAQGDLDLTSGASWGNVFEAEANGSNDLLVMPGDEQRSFLWNKVAAWSDDSIQISGGKMPPAGEIDEKALELLRLWITSGAPEDGTLVGTAELVGACLPDPTPLQIKPLDPPGPDEGVQLVMPGYALEKSSEVEVCFATYEDFCDEIPDEYRTPDGNFFMWNAYEIRQNVGSHHLLVQAPSATFGGDYVDPNELDDWACREGAMDGQPCDPLEEEACGEGRCTTPVLGTTACVGYEPARGLTTSTFSGTQQPQLRVESSPGVYQFAPCRTVVFWNSHAFNLTTSDTVMRARLNFEFAQDRLYQSRGVNTDGASGLGTFGVLRLAREGAEPYTKQVMCSDVTLPQGAQLTSMSSHTHQRGERSWWTGPDGEVLYENLIYNDPPRTVFEPPRPYASEDVAERTFRFCTVYNNGVDDEGNPDPETVTRASRIPYGIGGPGTTGFGTCEPKACVNAGADFTINCDDGEGNRRGDDSACDTTPGKGDGYCDACAIMGGVTTENEMFQGSLGYFVFE